MTAVDDALFTEFVLFEHIEILKEQQRTAYSLSTWLNLNPLSLLPAGADNLHLSRYLRLFNFT